MLRSEVSIAPLLPEHVQHVADNIREQDRVEIYETSAGQPWPRLTHSVQRSERTATLMVGEEPVALIGVGRLSLTSRTGVPWMIGTEAVRQNARRLLPHGREVVRKMMQGHDILLNMVHVENEASIRWLKSLGFTMHEPRPYGWRGSKFYPFTLKKEEMNV